MNNTNIDELRKKVNLIAEEKYKIYKEEQSDKNRNIYRRVLNIYESISNSRTQNEIENLLKYIENNIKDIQSKYSNLYKEYLKEKNTKSYELLIEYKITFETYVKLKELIINTLGNEKNKELPSLNNEEPKKIIQEEKNINTDFLSSLNETILAEKKNLVNLNIGSEEYIRLNKKIYNLCIDRENYVKKHYGYEGLNILIEIESLEQRVSFTSPSNNTSLYDKEYNNEEIKEILKETLNTLSVKLFSNNQAHNEILDYKNIIKSVFKEDDITLNVYDTSNIKNDFESSTTTQELLTLLTLYNIDGSYEKFKEKYKNASLGSDKITKKQYNDQVHRIKLFIDRLLFKIKQEVLKTNDKVVIKNNIHDKEKIMNELNQKIQELENIKNRAMTR